MRWLVSILLSVAFAAGIILFYQVWTDFKYSQAEIKVLQQEMKDYKRVAKMYREQEEKIVIVNALWNEIRDAGLVPDNWLQYPLSLSKTLEWKEVEKMMVLASNKEEQNGYRFKPVQFRVARVLVKKELSEEEAAQVDENAPVLERQDVEQMYELNMTGSFLIPKSE